LKRQFHNRLLPPPGTFPGSGFPAPFRFRSFPFDLNLSVPPGSFIPWIGHTSELEGLLVAFYTPFFKKALASDGLFFPCLVWSPLPVASIPFFEDGAASSLGVLPLF